MRPCYLARAFTYFLILIPSIAVPVAPDRTIILAEPSRFPAKLEQTIVVENDYKLCSPSLGPVLPISGDAQFNYDPSMAYNSNTDEWLVAWGSDEALTRLIRAGFVQPDGQVGPEFAITEKGRSPAISYNPDLNRYVLAFSHTSSVWAQELTDDGLPIGSPVEVLIDPLGSRDAWVVTVVYNLSAQEYLILSGFSGGSALGGSWVLNAQRLAGGTLEVLGQTTVATGGWSFDPILNESSGQGAPPPDVALDAIRNQYLIAYALRSSPTGLDFEVMLHPISSDLNPIGSPISIGLEGFRQTGPHLAYGIDQYLVVYGQRPTEEPDLQGYARRVSGEGFPAGTLLGPEGGFPFSTSAPRDVDFGESYGFLAVWEEGDVFGTYILPNRDEPCGEPFVIMTPESGNLVIPTVTCSPRGDCLVIARNYGSGESAIVGRFVYRPDLAFDDVVPAHWAWQFVEEIFAAGLTAGFPDGTYRPDNPVTRAEMAVFLKKGIHGSAYSPPTPDGSHPFTDIAGHWAEAWIEDLYDEGFTSGFPDGTYGPDNQVTRAEMAVFLKKAIHGSAYTSPTPDGSHPFGDIAGHWAEAWIEDLYDEGITSGYADGTYRPENQVTRAEMAVFLVNAFGLPVP